MSFGVCWLLFVVGFCVSLFVVFCVVPVLVPGLGRSSLLFGSGLGLTSIGAFFPLWNLVSASLRAGSLRLDPNFIYGVRGWPKGMAERRDGLRAISQLHGVVFFGGCWGFCFLGIHVLFSSLGSPGIHSKRRGLYGLTVFLFESIMFHM